MLIRYDAISTVIRRVIQGTKEAKKSERKRKERYSPMDEIV